MKTVKLVDTRDMFEVTITDDMFGEMSGQFLAHSEAEALERAKEFYAHELDTTEDYIGIISIIKL